MADVENPIKEELNQTLSASDVTNKPVELDLEPKPASITYQMFAEAIGSMFICICGLNAVNAAVIAGGASGGNWQVGVMFGLGIIWGIYTAGPISGGHLNPAITAAIGLLRPSTFPAWKVPCYWFAQYFGAWVGALLIYAIWSPSIAAFEAAKNITRGEPESDLTIAMYCGVAPFPAAAAATPWLKEVTPALALFIEAFGAGVLCWVVFTTLDTRNTTLKGKDFAPVLIGLSIAAMIAAMSPLTTGSFNPARDGGPRVMAAMFGWGRRAFPGFRNEFWLYFFGPMFGAITAGAIYDFGLSRAYKGKLF